MELSEYLERLTGQIRCRKARPMVEEELRRHIEDQAEAYRADGMEEEAALAAAVREMGDPVEAGAMLDRVHRPRMEWRVLLLVGVLSIVGLILQYLFYQGGSLDGNTNYFARQMGYTVVGWCCMLVIYRLDYTFLAKYAFALWAGLFLVCILAFVQFNTSQQMYAGLPYYQRLMVFAVLTMLFVPVYAGILFRLRGGPVRLALCALLLAAPLFTGIRSARGTAMLLTIFTCLVLLSVAILRGWFQVRKGPALAILWAAAAAFPILLITSALFFNNGLHLLADYQVARIRAFINPGDDMLGAGYITYHIRELARMLKPVGASGMPQGYSLPNMQNDYVIIGLFSYYGILAGVVVVGLVLFFLFRILRLSWKQKNQLGSMIGLACGLLLAGESLSYIYANLRGSLISPMFMPFLSYGLSGSILNFTLVGIFLSVYRGSAITDERKIKKHAGYRIRLVREEQ